MGNVYLPILILGLLAFAFAAFSVGVASLTGPTRYNRAKVEPYECGIEPTPQLMGRGKFPIKYYLTAMMFIIFDIEIVFLYPWAVANKNPEGLSLVLDDAGRWLVFGEVMVFLGLLTLGLVYAWRKGVFQWR